MFPRHSFLFNCLLVVAWAYVAFYVFPSALYLFIK